MFPSIYNIREIEAIYSILNARKAEKPSTECIVEELLYKYIFIQKKNSRFGKDYLLQIKETSMGT